MPWPLFEILLGLPTFALVVFRLSGLAITAPVLGSPLIPVRVRVALLLTIAAMLFPMLRGRVPADVNLTAALVGGVGELLVGVSIGVALSTLLLAGEVAGSAIAQQAGLALGEVANPLQNQQASVLGEVYSVTLMLLFLMIGGHRAMMAALLDTYAVIPMLSFGEGESLLLLFLEMVTAAFVVGIRLAAPTLIALFLTAAALTVLSRTIPQLHILSVGFTLKVLMAMGVAAISLAASQELLIASVREGLDAVRATFGLAPDYRWIH